MGSNSKDDVAKYILRHPKEVQDRLRSMRDLIRKSAPQAEEVISYGMPAYKLNGMLLYFAAHAHHIGFYPLTTAIVAFKEELRDYKTSKGSIQFPHDKPLPIKLIVRIVKFRVKENTDG